MKIFFKSDQVTGLISDENHQLKNNEFIQDMASLSLQVQELEYDEEFGSDLVAEQGRNTSIHMEYVFIYIYIIYVLPRLPISIIY